MWTRDHTDVSRSWPKIFDFEIPDVLYRKNHTRSSVGSVIGSIFVIVIVSLTELTDHFRYRFPSISVIVIVN